MRTRTVVAAVVAVLLVATGVIVWRAQPGDAPATFDGYLLPPPDPRFTPEQGGHKVTVRFTLGIGDRITLARFEEQPDRVVVTVRIGTSGANAPAIGLPYDLTATLYQQLGTRQLVDAATGEPIPPLPTPA